MKHRFSPLLGLLILTLVSAPSSFAQAERAGASRIVTIGGAATEIVFALGAGEQVVAVDLSSTYPPEVEALPKIGYVRSISPEGVLSVEPDLIVATGALGPAGARQTIRQFPIDTILLPELKSFPQLADSIVQVAEVLDVRAKGNALTAEIREKIEMATAKSELWGGQRPSVVFILQPPGPSTSGMAGGKSTRAHTIIEMAGGRNAAEAQAGFQPLSNESLLALNPDVIIMGQSPGHGGSQASIQAMLDDPALAALGAVQNKAVHGVPLDDLAFGPRLGEAVLRWNALLAKSVDTE